MPDVRKKLYPGEIDFFRKRPDVSGMATDDGYVILNPFIKLSDKEKESVITNESARLIMRKGLIPRPKFSLTPTQNEYFAAYSTNPQDIRETIAARILSGDPSAQDFTPEQLIYSRGLGIKLRENRPKGLRKNN